MTAAPDEFRTLFVMSLKARFTEKLRPWIYYVVALFVLKIFGSCMFAEREPMPVL